MASFERAVDVDPESVWAVLKDPQAYARWIAGRIEVQHVVGAWPATDASFEFRFAVGPLQRTGRATVLESHPPGHLRIRWSRGLTSESIAEIAVGMTPDGCVIKVAENPHGLRRAAMSGYFWVAGPLANARSLERLAELAISPPATSEQARQP